jgi:hypothetical protein
MNKIFLFASLLLLPLVVNAADAPASAEETVAPPSCTKPDIPSRASSYDQTVTRTKKKDTQEDFQTAYQAYSTCMKAYVDLQSELSKKHIAAANAAVKDVNDFNTQVNAAQ